MNKNKGIDKNKAKQIINWILPNIIAIIMLCLTIKFYDINIIKSPIWIYFYAVIVINALILNCNTLQAISPFLIVLALWNTIGILLIRLDMRLDTSIDFSYINVHILISLVIAIPIVFTILLKEIKQSIIEKSKISIKKAIMQFIKWLLLIVAGTIAATIIEAVTLVLIDKYIVTDDYHYCDDNVSIDKPVIYIYPEQEQNIQVKIDTIDCELTSTYPKYNNDYGWEVTARPDGTLIDSTGREYNYLFWEGKADIDFDFSKGFCVKGEDTLKFLEESLTKLGLTDKEQDDFISYWLPQMEHNNYNIISFQDKVYTDRVKLSTTSKIDTEIRVYMAWKPSDKEIYIEEQELRHIDRKGTTLVEWGGTQVK